MGSCCTKQHPRKSITKKQARIAYDRCEGKCFYCNKSLGKFERRLRRWETDHCKSVKENGESKQENYVAACHYCNSNKKAKPVAEWLAEKGYSRRCMHLVDDGQHFCKHHCLMLSHKYCALHQLTRVI